MTYLEVAKALEDFVDGTGAEWDWDDYISRESLSAENRSKTLTFEMCDFAWTDLAMSSRLFQGATIVPKKGLT